MKMVHLFYLVKNGDFRCYVICQRVTVTILFLDLLSGSTISEIDSNSISMERERESVSISCNEI
jgi:hypothetical protein